VVVVVVVAAVKFNDSNAYINMTETVTLATYIALLLLLKMLLVKQIRTWNKPRVGFWRSYKVCHLTLSLDTRPSLVFRSQSHSDLDCNRAPCQQYTINIQLYGDLNKVARYTVSTC